MSRFVFTQPHRADPSEAELDEDGDLIVQRREHHVFLIGPCQSAACMCKLLLLKTLPNWG